jgi:hypothetical protein
MKFIRLTKIYSIENQTLRQGDDFNFCIVNFPFTCSIFQSHLHMEYVQLMRYSRDSLFQKDVLCYSVSARKEATESKVASGKVEVITSKVYGRHHT